MPKPTNQPVVPARSEIRLSIQFVPDGSGFGGYSNSATIWLFRKKGSLRVGAAIHPNEFEYLVGLPQPDTYSIAMAMAGDFEKHFEMQEATLPLPWRNAIRSAVEYILTTEPIGD